MKSLEDRLRSLENRVNATLFIAVVVLVWVFAIEARAQEIGRYIPTPRDAVGWALGDVATLPESDRPFVRYVWLPPWADVRWVAAVNFSVNTAASHSAVIQMGTPVANGWMIRYDLRRLAPKIEQLNKLLAAWDGLAIQDPYFHVPQTNSGIAAAVLAPHLKTQEAQALAGLSLSTGAIYRADFLIAKMLTTLEGGKYYEFLQIPPNTNEIHSQQSEWLATLGAFEATTEKLNADQRSAIFRSGVTGKPRRIDVFYGLLRGGNIVTITHDISDDDVSTAQHPIRNLLEFQDAGREAIVARPNGMLAYALWNNRGEFVDSVPDNIAADSTIPAPHTKRLQAAISCIRCHATVDGFQPFGNDVQTILRSNLDVFSDLVGKDETREEIVDRLAGLYAGQLDVPDGPIGRARRDYSAAVYKIVGGAFGAENPNVVTAVHDQIGKIFAGYRYDLVTPAKACAELGLIVDEADGTRGLVELLGPVVPGAAVDPIAGTLRAGVSVNRADWEQIYADIAMAVNRRKGKQ